MQPGSDSQQPEGTQPAAHQPQTRENILPVIDQVLDGRLPAIPGDEARVDEPDAETAKQPATSSFAVEEYAVEGAVGNVTLRRYAKAESNLPPVRRDTESFIFVPAFNAGELSGDPFLEYDIPPAGAVFGLDRSYCSGNKIDIQDPEALIDEVRAAIHFVSDFTGKQVHLVGHSLGGLLAARALTEENSNRVASLHLLAPTLVNQWQHKAICGLYMTLVCPVLSRFSSSIPTITMRTGYNLYDLSRPSAHKKLFTSIPVPLQVVIGDQDKLSFPYILSRMASTVSEKAAVQLPNTGHDLTKEYCGRVLQFVNTKRAL